jgi:ATP-dependent RNA helicase DeaD
MPIEYVHRIGRTGRAGRSGHAITLITPRQGHHLRRIEHFTKSNIVKSILPTKEEVQQRRDAQFKADLLAKLDSYAGQAGFELIAELDAQGYDMTHIAAAAIDLLRAQEEQRPLEDIKPISKSKGKHYHNKGQRRNNPRGDRRERHNKQKRTA